MNTSSERDRREGSQSRGRRRRAFALRIATTAIGLAIMFGCSETTRAEDTGRPKNPPLHNYFGFDEMEIYKLEHGIRSLRAADLNGDGLLDLAVVNNRRSKIEIFYQRKPGEPEPPDTRDAEDTNELADPTRFRHDAVSSVWQIASLEVADVTGDNRPDLIFFGDPKELVIVANGPDQEWQSPRIIRNKEGMPYSSGLGTGDLNGDGRSDVALLGENHIFVYAQDPDGRLDRPQRYAHGGSDTHGIIIADADGDGRSDLLTFGSKQGYPVAVRLQDAFGRLGPQQEFRLPAIRSLTAVPVLGRRAADMFVIQQLSNRVVGYRLSGATRVRGERDWLSLTFAYPVPGKADDRPAVVADLDGDGRPDLVAADPKSAQLMWYRQRPNVGLGHGQTFPGLLEVKSLAALDVENDGRAEIFALSKKEKSIGMTTLTDGRLAFPRALPIDGDPVAFTVGRCYSDDAPYIAYVTEQEDSGHTLKVQQIDAAGAKHEPREFKLPELNDSPSALRFADVDQDGSLDLLIFIPYEPLRTMLQAEDGSFALLTAAEEGASLGLVAQAAPAGYCLADVTGDGKPEVLLAQKSFVRALKVVGGIWTIVDQYNPSGTDVNITGVAALFDSGKTYPRIVLYNADGNEIHTLTRREDNTYAESHSQPVGRFELTSMAVAPLAGDDRPTLMLADGNQFALLCPNRPPSRLIEQSEYETTLKESRFSDVVAGDLNHDGRTDLVVSDIGGNYVHILTYDADNALVFALKFRVFETKQFREARQSPAPSEMCIADVTGDGFDDLLLIAHDRILLYPGQ